MLSLPPKTLDRIKSVLIRKQKQIDDQIKSAERDDPILSELPEEAHESGTDSWNSDVHARVTAVKGDLVTLSKKIGRALLNLKKGTYGKCEKCGKAIEAERLEAMPTANLCISCSQEPQKSSAKKSSTKVFKKASKK